MSDLITQPKIKGIQIEIVAEAEEIKVNAMLCSKDITSVDDGFEATVAAGAQGTLRQLIKDIESSRKLAKAPILEIGKEIDGIAKDFIDEVKTEEERIGKLLGAFQRVERDKKIAAERQARIAEQKILVEASEAALASGEPMDELSESAQQKIVRLRQEASAKHEAVNGVRVRTTTKFEIVDEAELLKARSDLFSPDAAKIKQALKLTINIPGIKTWEESKAY